MTDDKIKTFVPSRELERRKAEASRMADRYISKDGGAPELDDLGDLSPAEYGQRRKAMADDLGTSIAFLDDEYRERRKATKDGGGDGAFLYAPEPWPDPVNGADLLNEISHVATKHIFYPRAPPTRSRCGSCSPMLTIASTYRRCLLRRARRPSAVRRRC
jgi:hypothetical protein